MKIRPVLLVEDDDNDVLFLRTAWKKASVPNSLAVVTDGEKALDYLAGAGQYLDREAHPYPCLLLLDLNLPRKTGFEVLRWILDHSEHKTLPVVVLTSSSAESDAVRAYQLGANSYVIKPSNPDRLLDFINLIKSYWLGWNFAPPAHSPGGTLTET